MVLHAREGVRRISCRVAEGYGPDDATTTGPAVNQDWSLGANSRPVRGGHEDSEDRRSLIPQTRMRLFVFMGAQGPAQPRR